MTGSEDGALRERTPHRDELRVIESYPQTQHKVELMSVYYGQYPKVLIAASPTNPHIDVTHIWLVEACAGAGAYKSAEHPGGYMPGCAILACQRAREIQRTHPQVTMHVVLIESNADYCAALSNDIAEFTGGVGADHVDVQIVPGRFEDHVDEVLQRTRNSKGGYYHSLWFLDPDGMAAIPYRAVGTLFRVGRGPEVIINLSASGLSRLRDAAVPRPDTIPHASLLADRAAMRAFFGDESWEHVPVTSSREMDIYRLTKAYAERFAGMRSEVHKLRSNGDEIRYFVHLSYSAAALAAFDRTYRASQRIGYQKGTKLSLAERAKYADELIALMPNQRASVEDVYKAMAGVLDRNQIRTVLRHAASNGYGTFDEKLGVMLWNPARVVPPGLSSRPTRVGDPQRPSLFDFRK